MFPLQTFIEAGILVGEINPSDSQTHIYVLGSFVFNFVSFWGRAVSKREKFAHTLPNTFSVLLCQRL